MWTERYAYRKAVLWTVMRTEGRERCRFIASEID